MADGNMTRKERMTELLRRQFSQYGGSIRRLEVERQVILDLLSTKKHPACRECAHPMVKNGACFKCANCGSVFGAS